MIKGTGRALFHFLRHIQTLHDQKLADDFLEETGNLAIGGTGIFVDVFYLLLNQQGKHCNHGADAYNGNSEARCNAH